MKREIFKELVLVFLSISLALIFGCSEESSVTEPVQDFNPTLTKSLTAENGSFNLPKPIFKSLQKSLSTTKLIMADKNTTIRIKKNYESEAGPVKVDAKVIIKKGSVPEDINVTMTFDTETGTISFSPCLNLKKDARFKFRFKCSDLSDIDRDNLDFVYLNQDEQLESADREFLNIKARKDEITLENTRLTHLSGVTIFTNVDPAQ